MATRKKIPLIDAAANLNVTGDVSIAGSGSAIITFPTTTSTLMTLGLAESVTGVKTFDKDTIKTKGTSTGVTTISTANTSATNYTATLPAKDGTIAMTSDITGTNSGTNTGDQTSIVGITGTKAQFDTAVTDGNFLYSGDITQYTDEMAQDAVGGILVDSDEIDFTYNDATPSITATIKSGSIDETKLDTSTNASLDLADGSLQRNGGTMTGKTTTAGSSEVAKTYTPSSGNQTVAIDCAVNNIHEVTGHASGTNITFTVANVTNSQCFMIALTQGAVASTVAGWFATIRWDGGTAPTLPAANKRITLGFRRTGTDTYDGCVVMAST